MANNLTPEISSNLQTAISGLVERLITSSGIKASEVNELIATYVGELLATDEEALSGTGAGLTNVDQSMMVAKKAISDWVGATPGALDTLIELADALQNNPDVITEILASLSTKASIEYVDSKLGSIGVVTNVDFSEAKYNGIFSADGATINDVAAAKYLGLATAGRLKFNGADSIPDVIEAMPDSTVIQLEVDVNVAGAVVSVTADDSDASGLGQSTFAVSHYGGKVKVVVNGETVFDPKAPDPAAAPNLTVPDEITLPEYVATGGAVTFVVYSPVATGDDVFNICTLRAYSEGRSFQAHLRGDSDIAESPVWTSPEFMVENLAVVLTEAFNNEANGDNV